VLKKTAPSVTLQQKHMPRVVLKHRAETCVVLKQKTTPSVVLKHKAEQSTVLKQKSAPSLVLKQSVPNLRCLHTVMQTCLCSGSPSFKSWTRDQYSSILDFSQPLQTKLE
jgi:hypothetical protein